MAVRRDHQVPGRVRIQIQDYEVVRAAINNVVLTISVFGSFDAENASGAVAGLADVLVTPGTPQMVHQDV
jgi:hypothetical protein